MSETGADPQASGDAAVLERRSNRGAERIIAQWLPDDEILLSLELLATEFHPSTMVCAVRGPAALGRPIVTVLGRWLAARRVANDSVRCDGIDVEAAVGPSTSLIHDDEKAALVVVVRSLTAQHRFEMVIDETVVAAFLQSQPLP